MTSARAVDETEAGRGLTLSRGQIVFVFVYYCALMLVGAALTAVILFAPDRIGLSDERSSILLAVAMALIGSCISYIRKLYKRCISSEINLVRAGYELNNIGTIVYYLARPVFSLAFGFLVYAFWKVSVAVSVKGNFQPSDGLNFVVMILSFFAGFLSGRFIQILEGTGDALLSKLQREVSNDHRRSR